MKKKALALLLAALMLVGVFPIPSQALGTEVIARDKADARDNVQMSKMVSRHLEQGVFDGTYDITLEAYANGYYKPVDVVLVVDQSGSMEDNEGSNDKSNLENLKTALGVFAESLKDVDEANTLTIVGFASNNSSYNNTPYENTELFNGSKTIAYNGKSEIYLADLDTSKTYTDSSSHTISYDSNAKEWGYNSSSGSCGGTTTTWNKVSPKTSASSSGVQLYTTGISTAAYRDAAKSVSVNGAVNSEITASINALDGNGATYTNYGMEMAYNALSSRLDRSRNSIVVLFTDGYPGSGAGSGSESAANSAISYADSMKNDFGAKIYTVGLSGGSDFSSMKTFLSKVQSTGSDYAYDTNDSADLSRLFSMIYKDIIGVNEAMTETAKLVDTLSDKFVLNGTWDPASGIITSGVTLSQMPYIGETQSGEKLWGDAYGVTGVSRVFVEAENKVVVSGFNFAYIDSNDLSKSNAVFYDSKGLFHGNKLRVVINVKPKDAEDDCWNGVEYGKLNIVPTELTQLLDNSSSMIASLTSKDSDYFAEFEVTLYNLLVSVENDTQLYTGSPITSTKAAVCTPADYSVNIAYTPASGTDASDVKPGEFGALSQVKKGSEDVTLQSIVHTRAGELNIVSDDAYVVTIKGSQTAVTYDGQSHNNSAQPYTVTVTKNGQPNSELSEDADYTVDCASVSGTDAGVYPFTVSGATSRPNTVIIAEDGVLTINKQHITMESASASKAFDGTPLTNHSVVITNGKFADGEGVDYEVKGSQTNIGSSKNWFTYKAKAGTNMDNYVVTEKEGTLTVVENVARNLSYNKELNENGYVPENKTVSLGKEITLVLNNGTYEDPTGWNNVGGNLVRTVADNLVVKNPIRNGFVFTGWTAQDDGNGNVTLTANWAEDKIGPNGPDNVPDRYQATVTFAIKNGKWGTETGYTYVVTLTEGGQWSESGTATVALPSAEVVPDAGYTADGEWNTTPATTVTGNAAYVYTCKPQSNEVKYDGPLTGPNTYQPESLVVNTNEKIMLKLNGGSLNAGEKAIIEAVDSTANVNDADITVTITNAANDLLTVTPDLAGYVFNGWEKADGTGDIKYVLTANWLEDSKGPGSDPDKNPNGVPDIYDLKVTMTINHGTWDGADSAAKECWLVKTNAAGAYDVNGSAKLTASQIPTGMQPDFGYGTGSWIGVAPSTSVSLTEDTVYTYSCADKVNVSYPHAPKYPTPDNSPVSIEKGKTVTLKLAGGTFTPAENAAFQNEGWNYLNPDYRTTLMADLTLSAVPTKTGYVFNGWSQNVSDGNLILTAQWLPDQIGPDNGPDGVPDEYQITVTFRIENGSWTSNVTDNKDKVYVVNLENGGKLDKQNGYWALSNIPNASQFAPLTNYGAGKWDVTPVAGKHLTTDTTYTYTYLADNRVNYPAEKTPDGYLPPENVPLLENGRKVTLVMNGGDFVGLNEEALAAAGWTRTDSPLQYQNNIYADLDLNNEAYIPVKQNCVFTGWTESMDGENLILTAQYAADTLGGTPDGVPDQYQRLITFKMVSGKWSDSTTTDKTALVNLYVTSQQEGTGKLVRRYSETGTGYLTADQIPGLLNGQTGSWDTTPNATTPIRNNTTYTYTADAVTVTYESKNPNTPANSVSSNLNDLRDSNQPTPGERVEIIMGIDLVDENDAAYTVQIGDLRDCIAAESDNGTAAFFNIDIVRSKYADLSTTTPYDTTYILDTGSNVLAITIQFPTENRVIHVYRRHVDEHGAVATIPLQNANTGADGTFTYGNNSVTIYSSLFSIFAITYEDISTPPSSDPTPSAPKATTYKIETETPAHGGLKASKTESEAGKTITLTLTPDNHYKLLSMTVTDALDIAITLTKISDTEYTFIMPASDVKVKVTYKLDTGVWRWLDTGDHVAYISGYPDSSVRPFGNITRAETAMMFYRLLLNKDVEITKTFTDVNGDEWYATAVATLASMGIINGYEDNTFRAGQSITRAEFTAIAMRFAYAVDGNKTFIDVPDGYWAEVWIASAATYGWIEGYNDNTFRPAGNITRAEAATIINRMLERSADEAYVDEHKAELNQFTDLKDNSLWYYYDMQEACNAHEYSIALTDGKEYWNR